MTPQDLKGIFPALPTPLLPDGTPDLVALTDLVERNLAAGVTGLVPMGGTGEFTALSPDARIAVVRRMVEVAAGAVPVVPGVLSPGFADAVEAGQTFRDAGADAIMLVTPFYVVPSQHGVIDYFRAYKAAVDAPLVYYDVPSRTGLVSAPDTVAALADDGTVIGMKVCNTDAHYFNCLAARLEGGLALMSGDDMVYAVHVMHGAVGGVLASAPMLPGYWVRLHNTLAQGNFAEGIALHRKLLPVFRALFNEVNPGPLKAMIGRMGHPIGDVSLPLRAPGAETQALIDAALDLIRREALA